MLKATNKFIETGPKSLLKIGILLYVHFDENKIVFCVLMKFTLIQIVPVSDYAFPFAHYNCLN
jgi:hypothetical protein